MSLPPTTAMNLSSTSANTLPGEGLYTPSEAVLIDDALQSVQSQLSRFAVSSNALQELASVFEVTHLEVAATYLDDWANGLFQDTPQIIVLSDADMNGAQGAYATESNTIYLAQSLVQTDSLTGLQAVILEEYGHFLDTRLSPLQDTMGDEGELFSHLITGNPLSEADLLRIGLEDDTSTVVINGQHVAVEQSSAQVDFNKDGAPDILWRNASTGENTIWFMGGANGTQIFAGASLLTVGGSWDIKAVADFNKDSNPDILWRNASTGENTVWFMGGANNTQIIAGAPLLTVGGNWDIKAVADFNKDSNPDILWRNASTGENTIWLMGGANGTQIFAGASLTTVGGSWDIRGAADYNKDSNPDLIWRNTSTGENIVWLMGGANNAQIVGSASLTTVGGSWDIRGAADFNRDSNLDILWRNTSTGENTVWYMGGANNTQILAGAAVTTVGNSWDIKGFSVGNKTGGPGPDLVVQNPALLSPSVTTGSPFDVTSTVANIGSQTASASKVRYWISDDAVLDVNNDILIGSDSIGSLSTNTSEAQGRRFTYDAAWGTGQRYLLFEADGDRTVSETNETNNVSNIVISVAGGANPDLTIQNQSVSATDINPGDSITLSADVLNQGTESAGASSLEYYLSNDTTLDLTDILLGSDAVGGLAASASSNQSLGVTYNAAWGSGLKYILFVADADEQITEQSELNNIANVSINVGDTGGSNKADYIVENVTTPSTTISVGSSVSITATIKNIGNISGSGISQIAYWLSDNDTLEKGTDTRIGDDLVSGLAPNGTASPQTSFTYLAEYGAGTKYILVEADETSVIDELDETNNVLELLLTVI